MKAVYNKFDEQIHPKRFMLRIASFVYNRDLQNPDCRRHSCIVPVHKLCKHLLPHYRCGARSLIREHILSNPELFTKFEVLSSGYKWQIEINVEAYQELWKENKTIPRLYPWRKDRGINTNRISAFYQYLVERSSRNSWKYKDKYYPAGSALLSIKQLADNGKFSRKTVMKYLHRLSSYGYIFCYGVHMPERLHGRYGWQDGLLICVRERASFNTWQKYVHYYYPRHKRYNAYYSYSQALNVTKAIPPTLVLQRRQQRAIEIMKEKQRIQKEVKTRIKEAVKRIRAEARKQEKLNRRKKAVTPSCIFEVRSYFEKNESRSSCYRFYQYYNKKGWRGRATWRTKAKNWEKNHHRQKEELNDRYGLYPKDIGDVERLFRKRGYCSKPKDFLEHCSEAWLDPRKPWAMKAIAWEKRHLTLLEEQEHYRKLLANGGVSRSDCDSERLATEQKPTESGYYQKTHKVDTFHFNSSQMQAIVRRYQENFQTANATAVGRKVEIDQMNVGQLMMGYNVQSTEDLCSLAHEKLEYKQGKLYFHGSIPGLNLGDGKIDYYFFFLQNMLEAQECELKFNSTQSRLVNISFEQLPYIEQRREKRRIIEVVLNHKLRSDINASINTPEQDRIHKRIKAAS